MGRRRLSGLGVDDMGPKREFVGKGAPTAFQFPGVRGEPARPPTAPGATSKAAMPPLVLLGHEWHVGSDDLPLVMGPVAVVHSLWCAAGTR